jgi:hypothetical protein
MAELDKKIFELHWLHKIPVFRKIRHFKGQLHEIFDARFLSSINPALIHGLKPCCIRPNIRRQSRQYSNFSGAIDPAETISAGSLIPLKFEYCRFCRRILGHMQNGRVDWWKKTEGRKSRATVPLNNNMHSAYQNWFYTILRLIML